MFKLASKLAQSPETAPVLPSWNLVELPILFAKGTACGMMAGMMPLAQSRAAVRIV